MVRKGSSVRVRFRASLHRPQRSVGRRAPIRLRPGSAVRHRRPQTYTQAMAYSEELADRLRDALGARSGVTERKMFGGVAWMVSGNMACGIIGEDLMVRLGREDA